MSKLKKKTGSFDKLSHMSGLSKSAIRDIVQDVIKNNKLLNSCSYHIFESIDDPSLSRVYECKNCKGRIRDMQKNWYEKGIEHSQKRNIKGE